MNLSAQFKVYLETQKKRPSDVTIKNYIADINQFVRWYEEKNGHEFKAHLTTHKTIQEYTNAKKLSPSSRERHLSSLRKFFSFLEAEKHISQNPFSGTTEAVKTATDPWNMNIFKNVLAQEKASPLTVKNYITDIKHFTSWIANKHRELGSGAINHSYFTLISSEILQEYKASLIASELSHASINRKLSSLRRYLAWANNHGLLDSNHHTVTNISKAKEVVINTASVVANSIAANVSSISAATHHDPLGIINPLSSVHNTTGAPTAQTSQETVKTPAETTTAALAGQTVKSSQAVKKAYSSFPPLRLLQKLRGGILLAIDATFIAATAYALEHMEYLRWLASGKQIFKSSAKNILSHEDSLNSNSSLGFLIGAPSILTKIAKTVYPEAHTYRHDMKGHHKMFFHMRHTRPNWYKKYHSYPLTHYFHFAALIILMTGIGFMGYRAFFDDTGTSQAALPTAPPRVLSFQGRLTDNFDNPITSATALRFALYDDLSASGSALLWEEVQGTTPDQDGIFSVLLGSSTAIPASVFGENSALYLGITVGTDSELIPRQQIATVAFAANSETLQGLLPITAVGAGTSNVVLALDSTGNLSIGGSATPTFEATGGQFTLSGDVLNLTTTAGSNSNVQINPDGMGMVDIQKPLQNTTLNNNIPSAAGAVEVNDMFAVLATSSGQSAFTLNQNGAGPILSASSSGVARFTLSNTGNAYFSGNVGVGSTSPAYGLDVISGDAIAGRFDGRVIGGSAVNSNEFVTLSQLTTGISGSTHWQLNSNALSPINSTYDVLVGGTATSSALVKLGGTAGASSFFNTGGNVGIGTTTPGSLLDMYGSAPTLTLRHSTGPNQADNGVILFSETVAPAGIKLRYDGSTGTGGGTFHITDISSGINTDLFSVMRNGNVGIGTTTPAAKLDVAGTFVLGNNGGVGSINTSDWDISTTGVMTGISGITTDGGYTQTGTSANIFSGNVGIGSTSPTAALDVLGGAAGVNIASFNRTNGAIAGVNINAASGDPQLVFTTSATGRYSLGYDSSNGSFNLSEGGVLGTTDRLVVKSGNIGIGTTNPTQALTVFRSSGDSSILIESDPSNTVESDNPFLKLSQDGSLVTGLLGFSGTVGADPEGNAFTGGLDNSLQLINKYATGLQLGTNGSARLTISSNGNVGIGTTSPAYTFDVQGGTGIVGQFSGRVIGADAVGNNEFVTLSQLTSGTGQYWSRTGSNLYPSTISDNVGIGTSTPTFKLDVSGTGRFTGALTLGTAGTATTHAVRADRNLVAGSGLTGGGNLTADRTFNIGAGSCITVAADSVGVTSNCTDAATLDSLDSTQFLRSDTSDSFTSGTLTFDAGTTLDINGNLSIADTDIAFDGASTNFTTTGNFSINSSQFFINQSTGYVGLGTTSPSSKLSLVSDGTVANLFDITDNGSTIFQVTQSNIIANVPAQFNAAGDVSIAYDLNFTNPTASYIKSSSPLYMTAGEAFNSSDLTLRTYNSGNVIVDSQALSVTGSASISGQLTVTGVTTLENYTTDGGLLYTDGSGVIAQTGAGTSGQCLIGGTSPTWGSCATGGGVTGSGTTNYITKFTSASTIGISSIFDNGNVGIGTTNPLAKLQVNGITALGGVPYGTADLTLRAADATNGFVLKGASTYLFRALDATDNPLFNILSSGNVGIGTTTAPEKLTITGGNIQLDNNTSIKSKLTTGTAINILTYTSGNLTRVGANTEIELGGYVAFRPAGVEVARIISSGNFGIGTTAPAAKLNVSTSGTAGIVEGLRLGYNNAVNSGSSIGFWAGNTTTETARIEHNLDSSTTSSLRFYTYNSGLGERMRINAAGNVGIGTTAPGHHLTLNTSSYDYGKFNKGDVTFANNSTNLFTIQTTTANDPLLRFTDNNTARWVMGTDQSDSGTFKIAQHFTAFNGTNEYFAITAGGNIGIGSTAPAAKLDIAGNVNIQGSTKEYFSGQETRTYRNVAQYSVDAATQTGTVKIAIPTAKNNSTTMQVIKITGYNYVDNGGAWEAIVSGYNYTSGWINTSAEIRGSAPFTSVRLGTDGTTDVILLGDTTTVWQYPQIFIDAVHVGYTNEEGFDGTWALSMITDETGITVEKTPTIKTYIATSGNFGIGTTAPSTKLDVAGTFRASGVTTLSNYTTNGGLLYTNGTGVVAQTGAGTGTQCLLGGTTPTWGSCSAGGGITGSGTTNYITKFTSAGTVGNSSIFDNGNIGIGTTAPAQQLTVSNTGDAILLIQGDNDNVGGDDNTQNAILRFATDGGATGWDITNINGLGSSRLDFVQGVNTPLSLTSGGNVGIGTTAPGSLLHVSGTGEIATFGDNTHADSWALFRDSATNGMSIGYSDATIADSNGTGLISTGSKAFAISAGTASAFDTITSADFVITSTSLVGVGLSNPGVEFQVNVGNDSTPTLGSAVGGFALTSANNLYGMYAGVSTNGNTWFQSQRNDAATTTYSLLFNPSGGNVGVGTLTPGALLDVGGTGRFSGTLTANGALIANGAFTLGDNGDTGSINTSDWDISTTGVMTGISSITTDGGYTQTGTGVNIFSGNVGIGTTSTLAKLHVDGTALFNTNSDTTPLTISRGNSTTEILQIGTHDSATNFVYTNDEAANSLNFRLVNTDTEAGGGLDANDNTILTLRGSSAGGNVGIGSTLPAYKLEVVGTFRASGVTTLSNYTTNGGLLYTNGTGVVAQTGAGLSTQCLLGGTTPTWGSCSAGGGITGSGTTNYITKFTSAGTVGNSLLYDNGTNVGIGTTAPGATLQINANSNTVYNLHLNNSGGLATGALITGGNTGSDASLLRIADYTNANAFFTVTDGNSYFQNGNVGIGTSTPVSLLQMRGTAPSLVLSNSTVNTANSGTIDLLEDDNAFGTTGGYGFRLAYDGVSNIFNISSSNATTSTIDALSILRANGNVGIGDTSPSYKLDVAGTGRFTGNLDANSGLDVTGASLTVGGSYSWTTAGVITAAINETINGIDINAAAVSDVVSLALTTAGNSWGSTGMLVSGNVGIGTTTAGAKLDLVSTGTTTHGLNLTANSLTTGFGANLTSTSTGLTTGGLLNLDWSPTSATAATGDLFSLNIGANGTIGNLFNIKDNGSSIFSVSQSNIIANVPAQFNAAGDVSIAYDLNFTNPTASYIKSNAPMYLTAGKTYNSSDLTLETYNKGNVNINTEALNLTGSATISAELTLSNKTTNGGILYANGSGLVSQTVAGTTSQCLIGGTTPSWGACTTGGGVSGTGTTNYVAKFTGTGTVGNSSIFDNGNVGIGTTTTTSKLTVLGSIDASGQFLGQAADSATAPSFSWTGDTNLGIFRPTTDTLGFTTGGSERMRITSNGNVGIGGTAPTSRLQIGTDTVAQQWSGSTPYVLIQGVDNETETMALQIKDENQVELFRVSTLADTGVTGGKAYFGGNVGIGSTSPSEKLDVIGTIKARNGLIQQNGSASLTIEALDTGSAPAQTAMINLIGYGTRAKGIMITDTSSTNEIFIGEPYSGAEGISFGIDTTASGQAEYITNSKLFINTSGNVGIGTTNPQHQLDVWSATGALRIVDSTNSGQGLIRFGNSTSEYIRGNSVLGLSFITGSSEKMTILPGGNVGIGETNPTLGKLQVNGMIAAASGFGINYGGNYKTYEKTYSVNTATPATLVDESGTAFDVTKSYKVQAVISSTGTATGATAFFYGNGTTFTLLKSFEAGTSSNHIEFYLDAGVPKVRLYAHPTLYNVSVLTEELINKGRGGSENYLYADAAGNIGIGSTSPTNKLEVAGTFRATGATTLSNYTTNGGLLYANGSGLLAQTAAGTSSQCLIGGTTPSWAPCSTGGGITGSGTTNYITKFTGAGTVGNSLIYDTGANVGIGTTVPTSPLHITTATNHTVPTMNITHTAANPTCSGCTNQALQINALHALGTSQTNIGLRVDVGNATTNYAALLMGGNVGIGSTAPAAELDMASGSLLFNDTDYSGIYFGEMYKDASAHSSDWAYIRQTSANGQLEIGSDANVDFYETDGRSLMASFDLNAGVFKFNNALQAMNSTGIGLRDDAGTVGLWVEDGANVGVGTTNPVYKFDVAGDARFTGNIGIAGGAPTTNRALYSLASYTDTGYGLFSTVTGTDASVYGSYTSVNAAGTLTANRSSFGAFNSVTSTADDGMFQNSLYGSYSQVQNSNGTTYDTAYGAYNFIQNSDTTLTATTSAATLGYVLNNSTGTLTNAYGTLGQIINNTTGTISNARGAYGYVRNDEGTMTSGYAVYAHAQQLVAGGTMTNAYGGYFNVSQSAGTITNGYGVYITTIDGTNNYGLYQAASTNKNYFAGNVGIGSTTPGTKLDVTGTFRASGVTTLSNYTTNGGLLFTNGSGVVAQTAAGTGSQCLLGGTTPSWGDCATGGLNGSGTINYLPKFTGSTTLGNSSIFDNGNVGIGNITPSAALSVSGPSGNPSLSANTNNLFSLKTSTTPELAMGGYSTSPYAMWMQVKRTSNDGTSWPLAIQPLGGNVGIGLSNPQAQLEIATSTLGGGVLRLSSSDTSVVAGEALGSLEFYSNDASVDASGVRAAISAIENDGGFGRSYDLTFSTGSVATATEKLRITKDGNVGIGSTTPATKLDVNGTAVVGGFNSARTPLNTSTNASGLEVNIAANSLVTIGDSGTGVADPAITLYRTGSGFRTGTAARIVLDSSNFDFRIQQGTNNTAYGAETYTDRLVINVNGNVGIGSTGPTQKLDVDGNVKANNYYVNAGAGNGLGFWGGAPTTYGTFMSNSATYQYGDVTDYYIANVMSSGTGRGFTWSYGGSPSMALNANSGNLAMKGTLTVNGTGNSSIAGNLGIGTTAPSTLLALSGGIGSQNGYNLSSAGEDNLLANGDFEQGGTYGWTGVDTVVTGGYAGNYAGQSAGSQSVESDDYIPVDPTRDVIQLEGYFKKTVAGTTPGLIYFGYKAYDANKTVITTAPCGSYCYFAASGYTLPVDGAWHKFSATTTGEGTSYPNFPVGTKFIRVLVLINYSASADSVTQMDHVSVRRINNGPLFVGNNFASTNMEDEFQSTKLYTNSSNNFIIDPPTGGHILPATDSTTDLGTSAVRFRNGYFDTLYGDGSNLTGLTADAVSFANITSGTNTTAAMTVGSGGSLTYSGSGTINASSLAGLNLTSASTVNTVVARNGSGDINARLFRSEYDATNSSIGYIMTQIDTASNNYIRPSTPAQLVTGLGLEAGGSRDIWVEKAGDTMTGRLNLSASGLRAAAMNDITTRTDSGFFETSTATLAEGWPEDSNNWYHLLTSTHTSDANYYSMQFAADFFSSNDVFYRSTSASGTTAWNRLWHQGNDGSGSGLDADLLDGANKDTAYNSFGNGTIPIRNSSGYLFTNYLNTTANVTGTTASHFAIQTGTDGYIRWQTPADARTSLGLVAGGAGDIWVEKAGDTITGQINIVNASTGSAYNTAPLEINEAWNTGLGEAPAISFHYSGAVASQIGFLKGDNSGDISILDNPGTGYKTLRVRDLKIGTTAVIDGSRNLVNVGTITSGLINGQTISSAANFTGTVTIAGNLDTNLTQGSVPFIGASGILSQDGTNFQWDDANNRLGIGTAAPAYSLQVGVPTGGSTIATSVFADLENPTVYYLDPANTGDALITAGSVKANGVYKHGANSGITQGTAACVTTSGGIVTGTGTCPGAGGITGSGTTNYIPKFTGASTLGNSLVFDNGTNVGIGTSSPDSKLDISQTGGGAGAVNALRLRAGNDSNYFGNNQIVMSYNNGTSYSHAIKTRHQTVSDAGNAIDFYLWDAGTDAAGTVGTMHVMSLNGGNVGIGTTNPQSALEVSSDSGIRLGQYASWGETYSAASAVIGNNIYVNPADVVSRQVRYRNTHASYGHAYAEFYGGDVVFNAYTGSVTAGAIVSAQERMRIEGANGYVGIGSITPAQRLDVGGNVALTGALMMNNAQTMQARNSTGTYETYFWPRWSDNATYMNFGDGGMYIRNNSSTNAVRIATNGNVGIGTTTTGEKLVVAGNVDVLQNLYVRGVNGTEAESIRIHNNNADTYIDYHGGSLNFRDQGTGTPTLFFQDATGNIGIGTTNPTSKLRVEGGIYASGSMHSNDTFYVGGASGTSTWHIKTKANVGALINQCDGTPGGTGYNTFCISSSDGSSEMKIYQDGNVVIAGGLTSSGDPDVAEQLPVNDLSINEGDILSAANPDGLTNNRSFDNVFGTKADTTNKNALIGVVSTNPSLLIGQENAMATDQSKKVIDGDRRAIVLAGRIPTKVSTINGPIKAGDSITSSSIPGVGMKATSAGTIVGRALQNFDGTAGEHAEIIECPAGTPTGVTCAKIIMMMHISYADPEVQIADSGNFTITGTDTGSFKAWAGQYNFERKAGFADAVIARLVAGITTTQQLVVNGQTQLLGTVKIGTQTLQEYILSVINNAGLTTGNNNTDQIATNVISPLASDKVTVDGNMEVNGTLKAKRIEADEIVGLDAKIATLSAQTIIASRAAIQNITNITNVYTTASESGQIASTSGDLMASESAQPTASESATASASAEQIEDFTNNEIQTEYMDLASSSAALAYTPTLSSDFATFTQGLMSFGPTTLSDTAVTGQFSVNGTLIIAENSINTLGGTLEIQPLSQGDVSFMAGMMTLDTDGNLNVNGNAYFAKDVTVKGTLAAGIISPVPSEDLIIRLPSMLADGPNRDSKLVIQNASGSGVLEINNRGDLTASGSGIFANVSADNFKVIRGVSADISATQSVATSSAGVATVKKNYTERTIVTPFVTENSLIYLTPVGATGGLAPYVARQTAEDPENGIKGSFTIQIPANALSDLKVNWFIVN